MIRKVLEKYCLKQAKLFFKKVKGQKAYQSLFEELYSISLQGFNIGIDPAQDTGEQNAINYIFNKLKQKDKLVIFDVGANIGKYSKWLSQVFNNATKIYAFEPSKYTYEVLINNTNTLKNIQVLNFGFGDENTTLKLYTNKKASGLASVYKRKLDHFNIDMNIEEDIVIKTIDTFCEEENIKHINFLKLDIEGNELKALQGANNMLKNRNIDFIQFEFGGCNIDSRTYFQDFYYLLKEDYVIYRILKDGLYKVERYKELYEAFTTTNYLAERINK